MVTSTGLRSWLIQRVSAGVLAGYFLWIVVFWLLHSPMNYSLWRGLFDCTAMRVFSFLFLVSWVLHAWIGIWTVSTDYIHGACLRLLVEIITLLTLLSILAWGLLILWGI